MDDDLRLGQLLCSRLCHDLAGPAGAVGSGLEMLADDVHDADTRALLTASGDRLRHCLAFYRAAFGLQGGRPDMELEALRALASGYLSGGRVRLVWPPEEAGRVVPADFGRLMLCLVMIAAAALPRGGEVAVAHSSEAGGARIVCDAAGRGAAVPEPVLAAMQPGAPLDGVTARTVHAFYARRLARAADADFTVATTPPDTVRIAAWCPSAEGGATAPQSIGRRAGSS